VVEYYKRFAKVREIDATGDISEIYAQSKMAVLPQTIFVLGPKGSGKTQISNKLSDRTNMNFINFNEFVQSNGLCEKDDETVCMALVKALSEEIKPRVILENFP